MNIYEKLQEIHKSVGYIQKGKKGKQYQYVGSSDVLATIRHHMNEQKIILVPEVQNASVREYETNKGTLQLFTELTMTMTWINVENPEEKIVVPWYAQGMDLAGEKGVGKALTYGEKYFLLKFFNIATDKDDPDAFQDKVQASKPKPRATKEQLEELENLIKEYSAIKELDQNNNQKLIAHLLGKLNVQQFEEAEEKHIASAINYMKNDLIKKAKEG